MSTCIDAQWIARHPDLLKAAQIEKRSGGYPANPGTGPKGETCKTCYNLCRTQGFAKEYKKCGVMRQHWTGGAGTDIRVRSKACSYWIPRMIRETL